MPHKSNQDARVILVGCAEDDIARQLGSDAQMTGAKGYRRNKSTGELEYVDISVCKNCQVKYDKANFLQM